jgi:hypothetical protein
MAYGGGVSAGWVYWRIFKSLPEKGGGRERGRKSMRGEEREGGGGGGRGREGERDSERVSGREAELCGRRPQKAARGVLSLSLCIYTRCDICIYILCMCVWQATANGGAGRGGCGMEYWLEYIFGICKPNQREGKLGSRSLPVYLSVYPSVRLFVHGLFCVHSVCVPS